MRLGLAGTKQSSTDSAVCSMSSDSDQLVDARSDSEIEISEQEEENGARAISAQQEGEQRGAELSRSFSDNVRPAGTLASLVLHLQAVCMERACPARPMAAPTSRVTPPHAWVVGCDPEHTMRVLPPRAICRADAAGCNATQGTRERALWGAKGGLTLWATHIAPRMRRNACEI